MPNKPRLYQSPVATNTFSVPYDEEVEEGPLPGSIIKPVEEKLGGKNFPYRGPETHGVNPLYDVPPPDEAWEGGIAEVETKPDEPEEHVQPVRIVNLGAKEITEIHATNPLVGANPRMIVGRHANRTSCKIKNLGAVRIWIAGDMMVSKIAGYPIEANATEPVDGNTEIYAITDDGNEFAIAVLMTVTVEIR